MPYTAEEFKKLCADSWRQCGLPEDAADSAWLAFLRPTLIAEPDSARQGSETDAAAD